MEYRGMPERSIRLSAPLLPAERPCPAHPPPSVHDDARMEYRGMPERSIRLSAPLLPAERPCEFIKRSQWERRAGQASSHVTGCVHGGAAAPASPVVTR
ncbi:Hypothetical protein SMAX5B_018939 [Scophthalmus maximus]|uniref:Uncharacterized protein n=1 Tax=Scophthalmus maximus TaxID=52904 RepID=A0A2U9C7B0_SCOMX|nr:Hypothetical protein SMAX5B_018939 [Scophthalmus maximus]